MPAENWLADDSDVFDAIKWWVTIQFQIESEHQISVG